MDVWNPTAYLNTAHQPGGIGGVTTAPSWSCPYKTIQFSRCSVHFSSGTIAAAAGVGWGGPPINLVFTAYCGLTDTGSPDTTAPGWQLPLEDIKSNQPCHCIEQVFPEMICVDPTITTNAPGALSIYVELLGSSTPLPRGDYNISVSLFGTGTLV